MALRCCRTEAGSAPTIISSVSARAFPASAAITPTRTWMAGGTLVMTVENIGLIGGVVLARHGGLGPMAAQAVALCQLAFDHTQGQAETQTSYAGRCRFLYPLGRRPGSCRRCAKIVSVTS